MSELIDLARYPIHTEGPQLDAAIARVQADLARDGCAVVRDFLTPEAVSVMVAEADSVVDRGHRSFNRTNAYFTVDDPDLPENHPKRQFFDRSNAFIPADNFGPESALRRVQNHPGFDEFIRRCLGEPKDRFFRYGDPLADAIVNMAEEGNGFPWHFDTNTFTVTLAVQNAERGGAFEYAPMIRREGENFAEVAKVLNGTSNKVKVLQLHPGDLQLFKGRYSLHRVAPLGGPTRRYVAILSYVQEPDMIGAPERTRQLYGRVLPIHMERVGRRKDALTD